MLLSTVTSLLLLTQASDTAVVAAVRTAVESAPIEIFDSVRGTPRIRGIELLDIDHDGTPEAFVWIDPTFRQTPTVLAYRYEPSTGPELFLEALAPGRLQPVSGRLRDSHVLGLAVDFFPAGTAPYDTMQLITVSLNQGMSLVRYHGFFHADLRKGFATYLDLSDRELPPAETATCAGFEFSTVQALLSGHLARDSAREYLVALTEGDLTIYHFTGLGPFNMLGKDVWTRPRPPGSTGLSRTADGVIALQVADGRLVPVSPP